MSNSDFQGHNLAIWRSIGGRVVIMGWWLRESIRGGLTFLFQNIRVILYFFLQPNSWSPAYIRGRPWVARHTSNSKVIGPYFPSSGYFQFKVFPVWIVGQLDSSLSIFPPLQTIMLRVLGYRCLWSYYLLTNLWYFLCLPLYPNADVCMEEQPDVSIHFTKQSLLVHQGKTKKTLT